MPSVVLILSLAVSVLVTATTVDRFQTLYKKVQVERVVAAISAAAERRRPDCLTPSERATAFDKLVTDGWLKSVHHDLAYDLFGEGSRIVMYEGANQDRIEIHTPGNNFGWLAARTRGGFDPGKNIVWIPIRNQVGTAVTPGIDHARLLTMGREAACIRY